MYSRSAHNCSSQTIGSGRKLSKEMNSELKKLSGKITEVSKMEKSAWSNLDQVETKVEELNSKVDLDNEKQIQGIREKSAEAKRSLGQYLEKATKDAEKQTAKMMVKKESLQNLWRSKYSITNQSDLILIARYKENMAILKDASVDALDVVESQHCASRLHTGSVCKTLLAIVDTPATPTRLKTIKLLANGSEIVFWSQTGKLISAYRKELRFFDEQFDKLNSKRMYLNVMSLTEVPGLEQKPEYFAWTYESSTPVDLNGSSTHEEVSMKAWLKRYSSQFSETSTLEKYNYNHSSNRYPPTVESKEFVRRVVVNPVRSHILAVHNSKLDVFSMEEDLLYTDYLSYCNTRGILVLPNGTLLVLNNCYIYNYRYEAPPLNSERIWTSNLAGCYGMSVNAAGCIYVGCTGGIHILSPAG